MTAAETEYADLSREERAKKWLTDPVVKDALRAAHERSRAAAQIAKLEAALEQIAAIENKEFGSDWEEIEEARSIARAALAKSNDVGL